MYQVYILNKFREKFFLNKLFAGLNSMHKNIIAECVRHILNNYPAICPI